MHTSSWLNQVPCKDFMFTRCLVPVRYYGNRMKTTVREEPQRELQWELL